MSNGPMLDPTALAPLDPTTAPVAAPPVIPAPPTKLHDVTIRRTKEYGCAKVENVPPEEFGITRRAKSIRDADYCYHQTKVAESTLIAQGYDKDQVKKLGTAGTLQSQEDEARDTVEDNDTSRNADNDATRLIWKTEHYVKCDYDGSGKPRLWRVTTGGDDLEILTKKGKPDVVKVDMLPFAAMTPIIMPHRFFGRSVADIVMDIQRIKTALTRGYLDQLYLTVNPPVEISMDMAHDKTLDDLLSNRPGKIVRTKTPGGLVYHRPSSQGTEILPAIEYFDATREWRTGVTRQGQGIDAKSLQDVSATASSQQFSMAQARMRLIARIFAETGIKDLFLLLHATIRRNDKAENTARLRGKWVQVNPREWKTRNDLTVTVGINGSKEQQMALVMNLLGVQEKFLMAGKGHMVKDSNLFASVKKLVEASSLKSVEPYFSDPDAKDEMGQPANPPQEPQPPESIQVAQIKAQGDAQKAQQDAQFKAQELQMQAAAETQRMQQQAQIENTQAQADIITNQRKIEMDAQLAREKFEFDKQLKLLDHQLKEREAERNHQLQMQNHAMDTESRQQDHFMKREEHAANLATKAEKPEPKAKEKAETPSHDVAFEKLSQAIDALAKAHTAPKRIVRGPDGRASHTETVMD